jgi:hypothetical protein
MLSSKSWYTHPKRRGRKERGVEVNMKLFVVYVVGDKIIMVLGACGQTGWSTVRDADVIAIEEVMNKWPLVMQHATFQRRSDVHHTNPIHQLSLKSTTTSFSSTSSIIPDSSSMETNSKGPVDEVPLPMPQHALVADGAPSVCSSCSTTNDYNWNL